MDQVVENANALTAQMKKLFLSDSSADIRLVNNYDWTKDLTLLDFLRDFGKNFNINTMLAKDIVASRLDTGISFTEFTYQILQSMDFLHLFQNEGVNLQIGGQDQWGNITAGLDLIRKKRRRGSKSFRFDDSFDAEGGRHEIRQDCRRCRLVGPEENNAI
jgi:tyrosyl-tRNA synthetase